MIETGTFVWIYGQLNSGNIQKKDSHLTNDMIVGEAYQRVSDTAHYKFLEKQKYDKPKAGIVLGYSRRSTGVVSQLMSGAYDYFEAPEYQGNYLDNDQTLKVWIVMPLGYPNKYYTPIAVLNEQIEEIK